jgi:tRNA(Ile)-lysidine synthase TilS/MesJ
MKSELVPDNVLDDSSELYKRVERSLITKYRQNIWRPFIKSLQDYQLVNDGDRVAVCMSGGKDSALLAKLMQELQRHSHTRFDLVFTVMDPGYSQENLDIIKRNAEALNIPVSIFCTDIYDSVVKMGDAACYLCARMRRGYLYKNARSLGCNKIALGHHYDDVIETILLAMFYGGEIKTMMPKLKSRNFEGIELIRPLYQVRESAIINWRDYHGLKFINCACRFQENCVIDGEGEGKRAEVKRLLKDLRLRNPTIEKNIFRSMENVNIDAVIGIKSPSGHKSFLVDY